MTRLMYAAWAAVNLIAGLALTFLAPVFFAQVAEPLAIGYLLVFAISTGLIQLRAKTEVRMQFLAIAAVSIVAALVIAITGAAATTNYQMVVSTWALGQGLLILLAALELKPKTSARRDLMIVSAASIALAALLYLPEAPRYQLGFFSAYLLITGVLLGIAAATPSK
jgi:hypothetical protein